MMKFKVFNKDEKDEICYLTLIETSHNVQLCICDKAGNLNDSGTIISLENDGFLYLWSGIRNKSGLKLDSEKRIITKNY